MNIDPFLQKCFEQIERQLTNLSDAEKAMQKAILEDKDRPQGDYDQAGVQFGAALDIVIETFQEIDHYLTTQKTDTNKEVPDETEEPAID